MLHRGQFHLNLLSQLRNFTAIYLAHCESFLSAAEVCNSSGYCWSNGQILQFVLWEGASPHRRELRNTMCDVAPGNRKGREGTRAPRLHISPGKTCIFVVDGFNPSRPLRSLVAKHPLHLSVRAYGASPLPYSLLTIKCIVRICLSVQCTCMKEPLPIRDV
jgi:hypothetical protein